MMRIESDSLQAIRDAETSLAGRARNIANANTVGYKSIDVTVSGGSPRARLSSPSPGGFSRPFDNPVGPLTKPTTSTQAEDSLSRWSRPNDVDLAKEMVGMQQDRRTAGYNIQSLKVKDRMTGDLLDLIG